jgi:hypothetical protein
VTDDDVFTPGINHIQIYDALIIQKMIERVEEGSTAISHRMSEMRFRIGKLYTITGQKEYLRSMISIGEQKTESEGSRLEQISYSFLRRYCWIELRYTSSTT